MFLKIINLICFSTKQLKDVVGNFAYLKYKIIVADKGRFAYKITKEET